jgi:hypothetical protein
MFGPLSFRKVFDGIASRNEMLALLNRHRDDADNARLGARAYGGEWFEIHKADHDSMLDALPPLFTRGGMFAMSEFKAGSVASVFFAIKIRGRERWFHGYCDIADRRSPDAMRAAIIAHETSASDSMTRGEKLEAIWNRTPAEFKGIAGASNPNAWPPSQQGKRTILVYVTGVGTVLKLLEDLTGDEIEERLPGVLKKPGGAANR